LSDPGRSRRLIAGGAIAACLPVLLATGSRSGLLGAVVLGVLIQTGPRAFRVPARYVGMGVAASVLLVTTVIPAGDWARMTHLMPTKAEDRGAASSNVMREDTIFAGLHMIKDHPWLGVGLGNFREVSRQVYNDAFYRPPHNSYLWAASEGGVFVLGLYLLLLWITWRDLQVVTRLAHRDLEVGYIAAAIRIVYLLFCFFALFADLWQSPFTYILIGQIVAMRRYVERLPEPAGAAVRAARPLRAARIDVVHGYQWRPALVGAIAGRLAGASLVVASKRSLTGDDRQARLAWRLIAGLVDTVVANADALRREAAAHGVRGRWAVIPSGIDVDRVRGGPRPPAAKAALGLG